MAVIALLLMCIAVWAALATGRNAGSVPGDEAWRRAAALVRREFRRGDLILFEPSWVDPVGRLHLGDLISIDDAARMDTARYARIWVLAIRGAASPEGPEGPAREGEGPAIPGVPVVEEDLDGISVRRYDRTPAIVLDDAVRALPTARVEGAAERGPGAVLAEVDFRPRRCVQVVPAAGGSVKITFPRFTLGAQLVGYVGLADVFTRRDVREPGQLELVLGGRTVVKRRVGIDDGWVRFTARTSPGVGEVTVVASAPSRQARERLICFAMESRQ